MGGHQVSRRTARGTVAVVKRTCGVLDLTHLRTCGAGRQHGGQLAIQREQLRADLERTLYFESAGRPECDGESDRRDVERARFSASPPVLPGA